MSALISNRSVFWVLVFFLLCYEFGDCISRRSDHNPSGEDDTGEILGEKNAVENIRSEWISASSLKLSWDRPKDATKTIKYSVKCISIDKTKTQSTRNTTSTFKNLEMCGVYKFVFEAVDESSKNNYSPVEVYVNSSITAPEKPDSVRFNEVKNLLTWKNSKVNPFCRTGVHLKIFAEDNCIEDVVLPHSADKYNLKINNWLRKFSTFTFNIQTLGMKNLVSEIVSMTVAGKTTVISNKNAVEDVKTSWIGDSQLDVRWNPPLAPSNVDYYSITVFRDNTKLQTLETSNTHYTLKELEACANHKLTFNAYDRDQITKYKTVHYSPAQLLKAPGTPKNFGINSLTFMASWNPVKENQFCVTGYHLKIFHENVCIKDIILPKEVLKYKLTDINSCSGYKANLLAIGLADKTSDSVNQNFGISPDDAVRSDKSYVEKLQYDVFPLGRVRLKWSSTHIASCVHDYVVSYFDSKGLQMKLVNETFIEISDLDPCLPHRVSVIPRTGFKEFIGRSKEIVVRTKAFVPGPVRNLYGTSDASGSVLLYWLPPLQYPACVDQYRVHQIMDYHPDKTFYTKNLYLSSTTARNCVHHLFYVSSMSTDGEESAVQELDYFHLPEDGLIDNVNFEENGNGLFVSWKTSAYEDACFKLFTVDLCALDHDIPCRRLGPQNKTANGKLLTQVPNITPCVTYKISISAMDNGKQYGFHSEIYHSSAKVFQKPTFQEIKEVSSHHVYIRWTIDDFEENRCQPLAANLDCTGSSNVPSSVSMNVTQTSEIFTHLENLIPFTDYVCKLSLVNLAGRSENSVDVKFQTLEDVPSQPIDISVANVTSDGVKLAWQPPVRTNGVLKGYRVDFTNSRLRYALPSWCFYPGEMDRSITLPAHIREYSTQKLSPFTEYSVTVFASTKVGFGLSSKLTLSTLPAASSAVTQAQYVNAAPLTYTITWKQPCRPNGILKSFKVTVTGKRKHHEDDVFSCLVASNLSFPDHLYSVKLPKLRPVYKYRVEISAAVVDVDEDGQVSSFDFSTPASMPPAPSVKTFHQKVNLQPNEGQNGSTVRMTLTKDMFDDSSGEILYYAIIVGRDIQQNNRMESGSIKSQNEWPIVNNWAEASAFDFILGYQATPPFWNPFEGTADKNSSIVFIVGDDLGCAAPTQSYCNGPLKPDTMYVMKIRAFTQAGYQDSPPLKFTTGNETYSTARTNYLLVVCVLVLLAFVVCGLYYVKNGHIPLIVEVRQRMSGKQKLTVAQTTNISIKKFAKHHSRLQNTPQILRIEFNELNEISNKFNLSDNIGKRYDNYRKNRYMNIIPYDETRVKIQSEKGDYINASFIEGSKNMKNRYIACQGPLHETFGDFWSMVLQYDVTVIIMLCQILENKRVVCEKYFPDVNQTLKFDGINIECTMFTSTSLYEERKIIVSKDTKEITVSHIKFLEWPDFYVPSGPEILVDFCYAVRKRFTKSPVIVHCSAGVGRTGTFIACDILLQHLPNNDSVSIFNTVLKLRKQRPHMVQSVAQYIYLYDCIFYAINKLNSKS